MLRYPALIISTILCLAGSAMAQQYYPYNGPVTTQLPHGHYYCQQHREICTHGMSTPEVGSYYPNGNYYPVGQQNCPPPSYNGGHQNPGYGQGRQPHWNNGRGQKRGHYKHNKRHRRW